MDIFSTIPADLVKIILSNLHVNHLPKLLKCSKRFLFNTNLTKHVLERIERDRKIRFLVKTRDHEYVEKNECTSDLLVTSNGYLTKNTILARLERDIEQLRIERPDVDILSMTNTEIASWICAHKWFPWFVKEWLYEQIDPIKLDLHISYLIPKTDFVSIIKKIRSPKVEHYDFCIAYFKNRKSYKDGKGWYKFQIIYLTRIFTTSTKEYFVAKVKSTIKRDKSFLTRLMSIETESLRDYFFAKNNSFFVFRSTMFKRVLNDVMNFSENTWYVPTDSYIYTAFFQSITRGSPSVNKLNLDKHDTELQRKFFEGLTNPEVDELMTKVKEK